MPVRPNDESRIVTRVVLRAQARRAVVLAPRREGLAIEGIDLPAILGRERDVKRRRLHLGLVQAQRDVTLPGADLDAVRRRPLAGNHYAERLERLQEESLARRIVAHSELDVVEHGFS